MVRNRALPVLASQEAADRVELAEVHRKDHHGSVPWFEVSACSKRLTATAAHSEMTAWSAAKAIDQTQTADFMDSFVGLL